MEGTQTEPSAKSRWCVHGFKDPDSGELLVFAPTPQTASLMLFLQMVASTRMHLEVADVKNAFCQGRPMQREGGSLFVEPCEGLELEPGSLIELLVPVYGLMDAPMEWHGTVTEELTKLGFRKCLLEPCWWTRRGSAGALQMVLIEVDDFLIGSTGREDMRTLKKQLSERFQFGKYREVDEQGAEFAGRRV